MLLEGAGLANVATADDPKIFTDPQSLSFERIDVSTGAQRASMLLTLSDAGDGAGTWTVSSRRRRRRPASTIDVPGPVDDRARRRRRDAGRRPRRCQRRDRRELRLHRPDAGTASSAACPYAFLVERPALARRAGDEAAEAPDRRHGERHEPGRAYCCPAEPFGPPPGYTGAPMNEDGSEHLYYTDINEPVVNFGVSVLARDAGALIDPFVLGSKDENDVQGYTGTPTDVNALTFDANVDIGAAGVQFPRLQRFYVSVDSRADPFTNRSQKGSYILNSWVNDLTPPAVRLLTTRVTAGRPLIVAQAIDSASGVDPLSLVIGYNNALSARRAYDPRHRARRLRHPGRRRRSSRPARRRAIVVASDYQEAKNINTVGNDADAEHGVPAERLTVVNGPTVDVDRAARARLRAEERQPGRGRRLDDQGREGASSATTASAVGVDKQGPGGVYSRRVAHGEAEEGRPPPDARPSSTLAAAQAAAGRAARVCR